MKILVIGREGQVARSLAEATPPPGFEIAVAGRPDVDLAMPETISRVLDGSMPDMVVNAAAYTAVDKAEDQPELAHSINAAGAGTVAEECERLAIPLIHISTDYVFDGAKPAPYDENDPVAPLGAYGRSKLEGERLVGAAGQRHIILRTAWVVSPFGQNFVKTMLRLAQSRSELGVVDDQVGTPTYAPHLAIVILAIALRLADDRQGFKSWGVYHAAGTGEVTWCGLAREVFMQSSRLRGPTAVVRPIATSEYPTPAQRPANSQLDCSKLARTFGIRMPGWRDGVAECVTRVLRDST